VLVLAGVGLVVALIVYPVMLLSQLEEYRRQYDVNDWLFSWSYGLAWGAWLFIVGAMVLLFVNNEESNNKNEARGKMSYYGGKA